MIVSCEQCGKRYRVKSDSFSNKDVSMKCRQCGHTQIIYHAASVDTLSNRFLSSTGLIGQTGEAGLGGPSANIGAETASQTGGSTAQPDRQEGKPRKARFRLGLVGKGVPIFVSVALIPVLALWYLSFSKTNSMITTDMEKFNDQVTLGIVNYIDEWFEKNMKVMFALAKMPDILTMNAGKQLPLLKAVNTAYYPGIHHIYTIDTDGLNVARSDEKSLKDLSDRQYFKDIILGKPFSWQSVVGKTTKMPVLIQSVPIEKDGKVIGVIGSSVTLEDLSNYVINWRKGETGRAFLLDEKGFVLAHSNKVHVSERKDFNAHPLIKAFHQGQTGMIEFRDEAGRPMLGHVRKTKNGWMLAIQQEKEEAFRALAEERRYALLILAATALLVVIIAWIVTKAVTRPIRGLVEDANQISIGDLNRTIETDRNDEIGDLAEAIRRMQTSIRLSIERLRRRRESKPPLPARAS